ncbi:glycosyl hydrolase family 61-domain-containing protein [Truncatella angustata]|uniref:lytic cellulose monooxygenase (C4-dehydrogenating) n=1 Tax=Truncatella angustata TaxID=152316 RepID=A0A9P8UWF8_9PEZI|nr:glycosyl hydrolase family 61-domain-containing protein [Truncatella angustata]KAH6659620.1 glycosyl hydrolase family 61-domain-containing protein [Truncatella angustata]
MKYLLTFLMSISAPLVATHTTFTTIYIDDVTQGDGTCVRMNMNAQNSSYPVPSLSGDDMACGLMGGTAVAFTCPATAGAKLSFEWRMWANLEHEGALDPSHKGPCAFYAKQVMDVSSTAAAGPGWFKIFEEGYDESTSKWCTEKLIDAGGIISVQIPNGLPSGNYLFRPELLALQNANIGDPQLYTGCAQVQVQDYSVSIPGYVKEGDASVSFNINKPVFPYPMPGPSVYDVSASPAFSVQSDFPNITSVNGATLVPDNCLIKEANWCGVEVADYSTEDSCWKTCYDSVPPTGAKNCKVWETKCDGIKDSCSAGTFSGPPNKGQELQDAEVRTGVVIPAADNLGSGDASSSASGSVASATAGVTTSFATVTTEISRTAIASSKYETTATATKSSKSVDETAPTSSKRNGNGRKTASSAGITAGIITIETSLSPATTTPCENKVRRRRNGGSKK